MSTVPDNEFDLEKLFLPAWAQEPASAQSYAQYEGMAERSERRGDRRGGRGPRRERPPGARRDENRPRREPRGPGRPEEKRDRSGAAERGPRRAEPRERREPPAPLPQIEVTLIPEEKGVESLARQIRMTGRAFPLFDIAQMILQKPDRYTVTFVVKKNPEGQPLDRLFLCALDDTLWLSEDEAVAYVLQKHFATFYQAERTATEPPKGQYTFVAQCGLSGVVLGPPNHHDYQNQLRKLHAERFSRMPFEVYKSRVKIVRDEAVVKKWVEDQSWRTEYLCLNMPEPLRLGSLEAVERHFRENHKEVIIKEVESHTLSGTASRSLRCAPLNRLVRQVWEDQKRFPLQIATVLSQQFARHGLQFFKVNKTITHVAVARPHYLDLEATPVSDGVKRIVEFINANPKCTRRQLMEALAPAPPAPPAPTPPTAEGQPAAASEAQTATPEQTALVADLHWLIHQGHVIEFANGALETAKKPQPKPPKPEPKSAAAPEVTTPAAPPSEVPPSGEAAAAAAESPASEMPLPGFAPSASESTSAAAGPDTVPAPGSQDGQGSPVQPEPAASLSVPAEAQPAAAQPVGESLPSPSETPAPAEESKPAVPGA